MNIKRFRFQVYAILFLGLWMAIPSSVQASRTRPTQVEPIRFRDESEALSGFTHSGEPLNDNGSGVAIFDYNNDGLLDIYITNGKGSTDGLMQNMGANKFRNVASEVGITDTDGSSGVAVGDLDNDGDEDIIIVGETAGFTGTPSERPIRLLKNNLSETGTANFTDVKGESGLNIPNVPGAALQAVLGDIDNDGLLDIFVTAPASLTNIGETQPLPKNHLFKNDGSLKFKDIGAGSNLDYGNAACVAGFTHYDNDGLIDLISGDCNLAGPRLPGNTLPDFMPGPLRLYTNNGDSTFTRRLDVNLPDPTMDNLGLGFWMTLTTGDINNDGRFDLFSSNLGINTRQQPHKLFKLLPNGKYQSIGEKFNLPELTPELTPEFSWGATFEDFNNDGWSDLFFAGNAQPLGPNFNNNPGYVLTNNQKGSFSVKPLDSSILVGKYSTGVASGDLNNDGFVDIVVSNGSFLNTFLDTPKFQTGQPTLLINEGNQQNNWITVKLQGTKSNRNGIGAIVKVSSRGLRMTKEVSGGAGFLSRNSTWLTFGLGKNTTVQHIVVEWPSGLVERFRKVGSNQLVTLLEGTGRKVAGSK